MSSFVRTFFSQARSLINPLRNSQRLPRRGARLDETILFRCGSVRIRRPHPSRLHCPLWLPRAGQPVHHLRFGQVGLLHPLLVVPRVWPRHGLRGVPEDHRVDDLRRDGLHLLGVEGRCAVVSADDPTLVL